MNQQSVQKRTLESLKQELKQTLNKIKTTLEIGEPQWKELLGLSEREWKLIHSGNGSYAAHHVIQLCEILDLNVELFFQGKIDYAALLRKWKGNIRSLPEKYLTPDKMFSRARSTQALIQYLEIKYGPTFTHRILGRLQISAQSLNMNPTEVTSSQLNIDLLRELTTEGLEKQELIDIGTMNLALIQASPSGRALIRHRSPKEMFQEFFETYLIHFETLKQAQILKLEEDYCIVSLFTPEFVKSSFSSAVVGTRESCLVRQGFMKCLLGLIRKDFAVCKELSCNYLGDHDCTYQISWEPPFTAKTGLIYGELLTANSAIFST